MDDAELREIQRIARRSRMTVAEWVRQALRAAGQNQPSLDASRKRQALRTAMSHQFPAPDIDQMLAEIATGQQILVPEALQRRVSKAAQRRRLSTSAWVREAIERSLAENPPAVDPLERLGSLGAPTGDIEQMLAEIDAGRG